MKKPKDSVAPKQSEHFKQAARELGCDESEEKFDAALKRVAGHKPSEPSKRPKAKVRNAKRF